MLKQVRWALLATFVFSGCINVLMLATPLYTLQVFETVVPLGSLETLVILTLITGAAILALMLIEMARDMILYRAGLWLDHELGHYMLENGLRRGTAGADMIADARALEQVRSFLASSAVTPLLDTPWIPIFLVALAALNPLVGLVSLCAAALLLIMALLNSALTNKLQQDAARANQRSQDWWMTLAGTSGMTGALGLAKGASAQWELSNRSHIAYSYSHAKRSSILRAIARGVRISAQVALYAIGAWLVVKGDITPGALVASAILLARALAPIEGLVSSLKPARAALAAYRRLKQLPGEALMPRVGGDMSEDKGAVELANVTCYHPGRSLPALRGVSLKIRQGDCLGIVGPNGSGKSTLAAILAGAVVPTSGSADLDAIPIARWQRGEGAAPIGFVPDEPHLYEGSVHQNIARFAEASLMTVARAAIAAGAHETLQGLPAGYETMVGAGGAGLSGRERRAVAFARALFGDPAIIVLDEPETGLDAAGIRALVRVLSQLKAAGKTIVLATHDPKVLSLADRLVLMNAGAVQAAGTAGELRRRLEKQKGTIPAAAGVKPCDASLADRVGLDGVGVAPGGIVQ